ncbi:MAG: trigger factor [Rhodothermales bacterium]
MQTEIKNLSDVELQLEITATFDDMKEDLEKALRAQRTRTTMKGFRPGKVPTSMVQKIYGKALAYGVAEDLVQRTFQEEVLKDGKYDVLGQPTITDLEFDYDTKGNLTATVGFGIRPTFELQDMSKTEIRRLVHTVEDDEIEKEVQAMLESRAEFFPEEGPATKTSYVVVDLERVDEKGETVEGSRQESVPFLLSDENLMPALRKGLTGAKEGETVDVKFPAHDSDEERSYKMTVKEVKRRELPELTDELAKELTNEQLETADALRAEIRKQVEGGWKKRQTEMFESDVVEALIAKHDFLIPASVVEMYQDAYVKELKSRQKDDKLPAGFDVDAYKESRREEAEDQARWMFIRDAIIAKHNLEVSDEQMDAHYAQMAEEGGFPAEMMKQYYQSMPQMLQNVQERMLSEQVFNTLASEMKVTEVDLETYRKKAEK